MKKHLLTLTSVILGLSALAMNSHAEIPVAKNLVCIRPVYDNPKKMFEIRTVIIGDSSQEITLQQSSQSPATVALKTYAVVIELIPGSVAREEWEVLKPSEFSISELPQRPGYSPEWSFENKVTNEVYTCNIDQVAYANPAISRIN